jgi:hypothetical protein
MLLARENARLFQISNEGDDQRALREERAGHPRYDGRCLLCERELEIRFRDEWRRGFAQGFGDAFGLRAGKASLLEFFDDRIGVEDQCLHMPLV